MSDFPTPSLPPLFINSLSGYCSWMENASPAAAPINALSWTANTTIYVPLFLPWPYQVQRVFWANGSSVTSTFRDVGVYSADGCKVFSTGTTAASGASVLQYVNLTALLAPGRYYMAYGTDSATANRGGSGLTGLNIARSALQGQLQEATYPLPTTMTPVTMVLTVFPLFGLTMTTTGF